MPFFDSLMGMLGSPDPLDEMKAYQARQNQANAGAANAQPGAPGAPGAVGPNGANAAPPVSTLPPGQEPQGTKTPEDMGSIIIDLTRREQAKQGFNQALGMGFGAFAQPRDREAVDKMFNVTPIDATKLGQGLMQINSQQQGQDRTNSILNFVASDAGAKLAADNNMTQAQLVALAKSNPGAVADLQKTLATPSGTMSDVMGMDTWLKAHGATDAERKTYTTMIGTKMMPADVQDMFMATQKYRQENGKDPPWLNDPDAYKIWAKDQEGKSADRAEANKNFDTTNRLMNSLQTQIQDLKTDPGKVSLMQSNQAKKLLAEKLIATDKGDWASIVDAAKATNIVFSPEEFQFLSQLQQMKGEQYAQAIQSLPHNRSRSKRPRICATAWAKSPICRALATTILTTTRRSTNSTRMSKASEPAPTAQRNASRTCPPSSALMSTPAFCLAANCTSKARARRIGRKPTSTRIQIPRISKTRLRR